MTNLAAPEAGAGPGAPAARAPPPRRPPARSPRLAAVVLVALAVLAGAAGVRLGRTDDAAAPAGTGAAPTATTDPAAVLGARITSLEARVQADPSDAGAWTDLGLSLHAKSLRTGDLAMSGRAADALATADRARPGDPRIITSRGIVTASRHDFAGARALVAPVVAADPFAADARAVLVDACIELGLYDEAERALDELGRLRPGLATLSRISYFRELHGDLDGALVAMRRAAATRPTDPWDVATLHTFTADLLLLQGRAGDALAELATAIAAMPDLPGAIASRADALVALGRYDEGVRSLEDHLRTRPDPTVAGKLSELRGLTGGDTTGPDQLVDRALRDEAAVGYDNAVERADLELGRGDVDAGLALAEEAFARRPDNVVVAEVLAYARFLAGDLAGALPLVERMTRIDSADLHQHVRAAEILHAAGDDAGARAQLGRAFELAPYPAPSTVAPARALAAQLGVDPPAAWRPPV